MLPESWQNAFHWGQYDSIYTTFLLACCYAIYLRKPTLSMFLFGSALAFKLQALFAGPVLLGLLFAGEVPVYSFAAIPFAYLAWMLPAALAGRSWRQLLGVYTH